MSTLRIELESGRTAFKPNEDLKGTVSWTLEKEPGSLTIALLWFTSGRGTEDAEIADQVTIQNPGLYGDQAFSFRAPVSPYSFSGPLITLTWIVEAVLGDPEEIARQEVTISPTGLEIRLSETGEA